MADSKNPVLQLLITAKDQATSVFGRLFAYLDDGTKVISGKIREAFSGLFGGGLDGSIEFEAALARVQAKASASEAEMQRLKTAAQEWAREIGLGADGSTKAAQALEYLTGAGLSVDEAIAALGSTLRVAKNEQISTQQAATSLTDVLSVMGLKYEEAAHAGDVLQKSADMTKTSVSALADAVREGGGEAVRAGYTFEQTVTILTAFAKSGLEGSKAGTALKSVLQDVSDPASKARQEMVKFGESTGDVFQFIGKLIELGPRAISVTRAFSDEAGPGLSALLRVGTDGLKEYGQALEKDAVGGLEKASATINNTTRGALDRLATAWAQIKSTLAEPLLKPIADGAELLSQKLNALLSSGALQRIADGVKALYVDATASIANFVQSIDWDTFRQKAATALSTVRQTLNETIASVQGKIQTVSDWTSAVFSPLTQAVDGYRLAWALANKDQEAAARIQEQIEARTAAIGRALSGTSAQYVKTGDAAKELASATEKTVQAEDALQAAQKTAADRVAALSNAVKQQAAEVERLHEANAKGEVGTEDYGAAVLRLWERQSQLKSAQADAAAVQQQLAAATKETVGAVELQNISFKNTIPRIESTSKAALDYQGRLTEINRELSAAAANAGNWAEGLNLTSVQLYGLKEAAAASAEKLALVRQAQRDGLATGNDVQVATKAAADAQDRYTQALSAYVAQQERSVAAAERATGLEQQYYDVRIQQTEAEIALAKAKGDVNAQSRSEAALADLLQQKADVAVTEKQREIDAYQDLIAATRQKLEADGQLDVAERDTLAVMADKLKAMELEQQALQVNATALRDQAAAAREAKKAQEDAAKSIAEAKDHAEQLAAAGETVDAFWSTAIATLQKTGGSLDLLKARFVQLQETYSQNQFSFERWANATARAADETVAMFNAQKSAVDHAVTALNQFAQEGGHVAEAQRLIAQYGKDANRELDLLNEQDLSTLRSAIDDANQKLRDMKTAAQDARDSLEEATIKRLEAEGDTAAADKRQLALDKEKALREANLKLQEAQNTQDLETVSIIQKEIREIERRYEALAKTATSSGSSSSSNTSSSTSSGSAGLGGVTATVNVYGQLIDQTFLNNLSRQLQPIFAGIARRSA